MPFLPVGVFLLLLYVFKADCQFAVPSSSYDTSTFIQLPINVSGTHFIDQNNNKVKLACTNWPSHMETLLPEGLSHAPLPLIINLISSMGYNCVRYTYSIDFAANVQTQQTSVRSHLLQFDPVIASNLTLHNPSFMPLSLVDVFIHTLELLSAANLLVLLDNHVSKAGWCCDVDDGNGWFQQGDFKVEPWINGLTNIAKLVASTSSSNSVFAMSLRNEVRAPVDLDYDTATTTWMKYFPLAADAVHKANPDLIVIGGGLSFATDLSFLNSSFCIQSALPSTFPSASKWSYEAHWYSWSGYGDASNCEAVTNTIQQDWAFVFRIDDDQKEQEEEENDRGYRVGDSEHKYRAPVFVTEIGDTIDGWEPDDYYNCVKDFLIKNDLSFSTWVVAGSYYSRSNTTSAHESFGLLDDSFTEIKSIAFDTFIQPAIKEADIKQKMILHKQK